MPVGSGHNHDGFSKASILWNGVSVSDLTLGKIGFRKGAIEVVNQVIQFLKSLVDINTQGTQIGLLQQPQQGVTLATNLVEPFSQDLRVRHSYPPEVDTASILPNPWTLLDRDTVCGPNPYLYPATPTPIVFFI